MHIFFYYSYQSDSERFFCVSNNSVPVDNSLGKKLKK